MASAQTNVARYRKLVAEKFISEAQAQQRTDEIGVHVRANND
jgi:hypothetical protein